MGLYVCDKDYNVNEGYLECYERKEELYVIDTDDLATEVYTRGQIMHYIFKGITFDNIVRTGRGNAIEVCPIFEVGKLIEIKPLNLMIYTSKVTGIFLYRVYFWGKCFEFQSTSQSFFPDFEGENAMVFHNVPLFLQKEGYHLVTPLKELVFYKRDLSVKGYDEYGECDELEGRPCTKSSFLSRLVLGV